MRGKMIGIGHAMIGIALASCATAGGTGGDRTVEAQLSNRNASGTVGVWRAVHDDDDVTTPPDETLFLYADGRLQIQGKHGFSGRWFVEGAMMRMAVSNKGSELEMVRGFEVDGDTMRMPNKNGGFVTFERQDIELPAFDPFSEWSTHKFMGAEFSVPKHWHFAAHPANPRMAQISSANRKKVAFIMFGEIGAADDNATSFTKEMTESGKSKVVWEVSGKSGTLEPGGLHFAISTLEDAGGASFMAFTLWDQDRLGELPAIVASMRIEDAALFAASSSTEAATHCQMEPDPDDAELQLVYSRKYDWMLYAPVGASIACVGNSATMDFGDGIMAMMVSLPGVDPDRLVREVAETFIAGLQKKLSLTQKPVFADASLPDGSRKVLCYSEEGKMEDGRQAYIAGCIGGGLGVAGQALIHSIRWGLEGNITEEERTQVRETVQQVAHGWSNLSSME